MINGLLLGVLCIVSIYDNYGVCLLFLLFGDCFDLFKLVVWLVFGCNVDMVFFVCSGKVLVSESGVEVGCLVIDCVV